jgi:xanthine dehydrogenase YagS FAD-binding subunit
LLIGHPVDQARAYEAARAAFAAAQPREGNRFKAELGRRTLVCALMQAAAMET